MAIDRLAGKSALITGAASGVGRQTARRFAEEGATTLGLFDRDAVMLEAAAEEIERLGARAIPILGDVTDLSTCARAVAEVEDAAGRLDILVSNAGIDHEVPFLDVSLEEWNRTLGINLTACFVLGQLAARSMVRLEVRGSILFTASISGIGACAGDPHYGASKAGLISLMQSMAIELVKFGIRVNSVSPGPLDTPLSRQLLGSDEAMERARQSWPMVPIGRLGRPAEIAAAFAYLASEDASYTVGQNLIVDGGLLASGYFIPEQAIDC
jgi:NAD(P)-dependent dehydrogenase (short-subunit alcohol dehydrogenase family)